MSAPINFFEATSVKLPAGGDTHCHPWDNGRGFTITTRLPGGFDSHENFRLNRFLGGGPERPDVLKSLDF